MQKAINDTGDSIIRIVLPLARKYCVEEQYHNGKLKELVNLAIKEYKKEE